jgi:hypothetical protein
MVAKGKILTMDNLRKQKICIVEWCCLCTAGGESPDYLLLHSTFSQDIWSLVFCLFGISWVMLDKVVDLLACWKGDFGKSQLALVWGAVPHCVMWLLWRERNNCVFEGVETTSLDLKSRVIQTLFVWMRNPTNLDYSSCEDFIDSCILS